MVGVGGAGGVPQRTNGLPVSVLTRRFSTSSAIQRVGIALSKMMGSIMHLQCVPPVLESAP